MADYKIIRVCVPYIFLGIPPIFLDFILPKPKACPENFFPIYILINKETKKIIKTSYNFLKLFSEKEKLSRDEKNNLKKATIRIQLGKITNNENKKIEHKDYEIIIFNVPSVNIDDRNMLTDLRDDLIMELIEVTSEFRSASEKIELTADLDDSFKKNKLIKK
ncbi:MULTISPECIES: hypothetical protein [Pectobacterium]|uniref:Uncharacterized protein n=1 Tax=Pectobacterium versatile TaxID=2488639 RepID=A0AAW3RWF9_9GAMM|nr:MULTISPECIES: hypothetical protein [Pectobacterium]MBA0160302.1 hypothetical protein [Pectobacterium versatile]